MDRVNLNSSESPAIAPSTTRQVTDSPGFGRCILWADNAMDRAGLDNSGTSDVPLSRLQTTRGRGRGRAFGLLAAGSMSEESVRLIPELQQ